MKKYKISEYDIHIRLDANEKKAWRHMAAEWNCTLSEVAYRLLTFYMENRPISELQVIFEHDYKEREENL